VIDAVGPEQFDGVAHALRPARLAGMHGAAQPGRRRAAEGFGKTRPGAACGRFVAVDRQSHDARMAPGAEILDQLHRLGLRLRAQQADAQAHRRQPVLLGLAKSGVERVEHRTQPAPPRAPVRRVDDQVGITGAVAGQAAAEVARQVGQAFRAVGQMTGPVEELEEVGQALEAEQRFARPRHRHAGGPRPAFERRRLEGAFEVHVHLGLGQRLETRRR
jgi:hypothetical protein